MNIESEAPVRKLSGVANAIAWVLAVGLSIFALYWVVAVVEPQIYRVSFLLIALVLTFLLYPGRRGQQKVHPLDWLLIGLTLIALVWPLLDFREFVLPRRGAGVDGPGRRHAGHPRRA
jgi:TRAP-type uncharacterized transport system fused permease subunit